MYHSLCFAGQLTTTTESPVPFRGPCLVARQTTQLSGRITNAAGVAERDHAKPIIMVPIYTDGQFDHVPVHAGLDIITDRSNRTRPILSPAAV
ncbi:hypothetical protein BaRGS_00037480 [Batillaria attramentaria]|uniref:Uncharacterized protein n=1 Tax=Batillaria attramentaria TaxID=370345 RepID=A0ABD0J8V3_9CAEN